MKNGGTEKEMSVYVFLADGFEEAEALIPADMLSRGGADVKLTSIGTTHSVRGAHNIVVNADIMLNEVDIDNAEAIILPGGSGGTALLAKNSKVIFMLSEAASRGIYIGAICAAPSILGSMGLLDGRKAAVYPSFQKYLSNSNITGNEVECDDIFITAKAAGSSFEFAFKLVELICGSEMATKIKEEIYY